VSVLFFVKNRTDTNYFAAFEALARRINDALIQQPDMSGQLVRINRPG
jgi:hypothetical protein